MMKPWSAIPGTIAAFLLIASSSLADVPKQINYQGYLTNSAGAPLTGTYPMIFSLCGAASGGACPWSESQSVAVDKGIFNVTLGAVTPITLSFTVPYFLDIQVGGEQMSSRQPLTSVGYAFTADTAATAATATNFSGSLSGDVIGTQGSTVVGAVGGQTAASVASGVTTANNATSTNTPNTIVKRDASGNFSAGTITASLNGNAATVTNGVYTNTANTFATGAQTINTGAAATKGLIVKGAASQSANLQEWQNSSGSAVASVSASGVFTGNGSGLTNLPAASSTIVFSGGTSEAKNGVYYFSANGHSDAAATYPDTRINLVPLACTARNLYVAAYHWQAGDGGNFVVTLLRGSSGVPGATALTCTVANTGGANTVSACNDLTNTVSISAGDYIVLKVDGTGATYSGYGPDMAWGFICQ